jgi:hypothetical protein
MAKRVVFSDEARADIRAIDRDTALRLLIALARFLETDAGDVKQLEGFDPPRYHLRVGDCISSSASLVPTPSRSSEFAIGARPTDE